MFDQPVTLLPHGQRGLYCHSSLPDDLGIQYQSYDSRDSVVAQDEVRASETGGQEGRRAGGERREWGSGSV